MDLGQMLDFVAVLDHGSHAKAAALRAKTAQAVGKNLRTLEHELGCALFDRRTREPTAAGRLVERRARAALRELELLDEELRRTRDAGRLAVRLGASPTAAAGIVGEAVLSATQQEPSLQVIVLTGLRNSLVADVAVGRLDLCICLDTEPASEPGLVRESLGMQSYGVVANANHPLARRRRRVTAADLAACEWILGTQLGAVEAGWRHAFQAAGQRVPLPTLHTSSLEFCRNALRSGLRLSVLPLQLVEDELERNELRLLTAPGFRWQRPLALYRRRGVRVPPVLAAALRKAAAREARVASRLDRSD
jgi:LysR family carnitine catabolism transcriptional activator